MPNHFTQKNQSGFTLIEVMIVMAIIGILASIAYPSYRESVLKARRGEAKAAINRAMQTQERFYTNNNTYVAYTTTPPAGFPAYSGENTTNSAYDIQAATCGAGLNACVQIIAIARQADAQCGNLIMDSAGNRSTSTGATTGCW